MRSKTNAHREPQTHERPKRLQFITNQFKLAPVTTHNLSYIGTPIEYYIRNRNREISDSVAVNHVAEIDQSGDSHALRIDEYVVVVSVTVNHTPSQTFRRLEPALQHQLAQTRVINQWSKLSYHAVAIREIPMKVTMNRRVIEICESVRTLSEFPTETV